MRIIENVLSSKIRRFRRPKCRKLSQLNTYSPIPTKQQLIKYSMISPEFFEVIRKRLCPELKRYIFQYIDIETRIEMLLENRPYFATGSTRLPTTELNANKKNPLYSLLSGQQLTTIYREGWLNQLFELNGDNKWNPKPELKRVCPSDMIITPLFGISTGGAINLGVVSEKDYLHSVITTLTQFRRNVKMDRFCFSRGWSSNNMPSIPIAALSLLLNINAFDMDINYYLKKKGFKFLIAMIKFIDRIQFKKDEQKKQLQEYKNAYKNRECMGIEDQLSKKVEKAAAKAAAKAARVAAKAARVAAKNAAKEAKVAARAAAKEAKVAARAAAKERVVPPRKYKLNIIA